MAQKIVVIDYGVGNLHSVAKAFEALGCDVSISREPSDLHAAERIVLPGVGAFAVGMQNLRAAGLIDVLKEEVVTKGKPFLGICLGMQLLGREGLENGRHDGLGWIPGVVRPLAPSSPDLRIPHVGWNDVHPNPSSALFSGLPKDPIFYFVHSYHMVCDEAAVIAATCDYGGPFCAALESGNIAATQFHPEKSQENGLRFLDNFLHWQPARAVATIRK